MKIIRAVRRPRPVRHLCIWPERKVSRAAYVPEGRALHLVDIENLCGGPRTIEAGWEETAACYRRLAGVGENDHVVLAANPLALLNCAAAFPGCRMVGRPGPNGADAALLETLRDVGWVAKRYDRIVIGSGDHCFAFVTSVLNGMGVLVGVVAREGTVSGALARAARFVRVFSASLDKREVA